MSKQIILFIQITTRISILNGMASQVRKWKRSLDTYIVLWVNGEDMERMGVEQAVRVEEGKPAGL